jgi:hypothetical protein
MHQTTIRFAPDLWAALEAEAARAGVSVAHYVRDAAVARLAFAAGVAEARAQPDRAAGTRSEGARRLAERVEAELSSAEAVRAQGHLARARAGRLRAKAGMLRAEGHAQTTEQERRRQLDTPEAEVSTRSGAE